MSISMAQLASRYGAASEGVEKSVAKSLAVLSQVGVGYVKDEIQVMHAVRTGTMLNSTVAEHIEDYYLIGPTVFYAPYVALGTSRMVARPFHTAAARRLSQDLKTGFITSEDLGI